MQNIPVQSVVFNLLLSSLLPPPSFSLLSFYITVQRRELRFYLQAGVVGAG